MPEGDTIFRTAQVLRRALEGHKMVELESPLPRLSQAHLVGRTIERVVARGKNLLFHFDDGRVLYTHMRMRGTWHVYGLNERWRLPRSQARVILKTVRCVAICFNAPVVELLRAQELERHPVLARLGPDLLDPTFDVGVALERMRDQNRPIAEVLLDQRVMAGVGNVFKSELLFHCRISPWQVAATLSDEALRDLVAAARDQLKRNAARPLRTTTPRVQAGPRHAVYRRAGEPCLHCGTRVESRRQGEGGRMTYWCPECQPTSGSPTKRG